MVQSKKKSNQQFFKEFLVHSPASTVFLSSIAITNISKTTQKLFELLDSVVQKIEKGNIIQIIIDDASKYKTVLKTLMDKRKRFALDPLFYSLY